MLDRGIIARAFVYVNEGVRIGIAEWRAVAMGSRPVLRYGAGLPSNVNSYVLNFHLTLKPQFARISAMVQASCRPVLAASLFLVRASYAPVAQQAAQPTCNRQVSGFESPLGLPFCPFGLFAWAATHAGQREDGLAREVSILYPGRNRRWRLSLWLHSEGIGLMVSLC